MQITYEQYERIAGLVGRKTSSSHPDLQAVRQTLDNAAQAARNGCFQEAEKLIASLPSNGSLGPATLDLKARICAQQGRLVEAQLCWLEAVQQSPGNESYRRSLDYLTHVLCPSRFPWILYITVMVLFVLFIAFLFRTWG